MPGTVVSYERFLDVRQRRTRVAAALTLPLQPTTLEHVLDDRAVSIDGEAPSVEQCGTRSTVETSSAEDCIGRDRHWSRSGLRSVDAQNRDAR